MSGAINRYWIPFFKGKTLGEINRNHIEAFIFYLESLPEKARKEQEEIDKALQEENQKKPKRKNAAQKKRKIIRYPQSAKRKFETKKISFEKQNVMVLLEGFFL